MNAHQIAERLISFGLAPVELLPPNHPAEAEKPPEKRGKAPFVREWQKRPAAHSVEDLPDLMPECNVGVRTGRIEGAKLQVVVVDIDREKSCWWAKEHLPQTPIVTISGRDTAGWRGQHWYYKRPETSERVGGRVKVQWVNDFDEGRTETLDIDVKADEGQVVAPGSVHGTGGVYEEASEWTAEAFAALPTFDPSWFPRTEAEPAKPEEEPTIPEVPVEEKRRRFTAYLKHCQPAWPSMPPAGAGVYVLGVARFGVWGLAMEPRDAAKLMHESDWNKRCHDGSGKRYPWNLAELSHKCRDAAKPSAAGEAMRKPRGWALQPEEKSDRRCIEITADLPKLVEETVEALAAMPDAVYVHTAHLATIAADADEPIHWLNHHALVVWMGRAATFQKHVEKGRGDDKEVVIEQRSPPLTLAQSILSIGTWPGLRQLKRVSHLPPVTLAGRVSDRPGYDAASRVYYLGNGVDLPQRPTRDEALTAVNRIFRFVRVVNFREAADKARWLSLVLTLATRTAYDTCPVYIHRAADVNSGKTTSAHVAYGLLYGELPEDAEQKDPDDSEWSKTVHGWSRMPLVLWDNEKQGSRFANAKLAKIITNPRSRDRELREHRFLRSDFSGTVFLVTGNNLTLDSDMAARCLVTNFLRITEVDPDFDPTNQQAFERARGQALRDVYTIVRAWAVAGCPTRTATPHRKFLAWSSIVQQICLWLGFADPVSDNSALDSDRVAAETILWQLGKIYGDEPWRAADLHRRYCEGDEKATEAVGAVQVLSRRRGRFESAIALGQALGVLVDREMYVDGIKLRLCQAPRIGGVTRYRVAGAANLHVKRSKTASEPRSDSREGSSTTSA